MSFVFVCVGCNNVPIRLGWATITTTGGNVGVVPWLGRVNYDIHTDEHKKGDKCRSSRSSSRSGRNNTIVNIKKRCSVCCISVETNHRQLQWQQKQQYAKVVVIARVGLSAITSEFSFETTTTAEAAEMETEASTSPALANEKISGIGSLTCDFVFALLGLLHTMLLVFAHLHGCVHHAC